MKYLEMIQKVQDTCGLDAEDSALAMRVVLETLGERLHHTERKHLADQLPRELKPAVWKRDYVADFDLEQFYTRVASRERIRYSQAVERTRCVMSLIQQGVSPGEIRDIQTALPDEYKELFGASPEGPLSPSAV